jgi:hypothetical protein
MVFFLLFQIFLLVFNIFYLSNLLNNFSSRVIVLVNSMPEAHEEFLPVFYILNKLRNVFLLSNLLKHSKNSFVSSL